MSARRDHRLQAWTQRVVLAALLAATLAAIIAHTGPEPATAEGSPTPAASPQERVILWLGPVYLLEPSPAPEPTPQVVARYEAITMTEAERRELAAVIYLEARGESAEGQQAVAEVVFNRVIHQDFPDSIHGVLHQGEGSAVPQFSTIGHLEWAEPTQAQYNAIDAALYGPSILPDEVVFFSQAGENDRVWGEIGGHVFCYAYGWE